MSQQLLQDVAGESREREVRSLKSIWQMKQRRVEMLGNQHDGVMKQEEPVLQNDSYIGSTRKEETQN